MSADMEGRLEASLREFGFIKPVVARRTPDNSLQILGGEHRARKAREMGMAEIPVIVLEGVDDRRAKAMGLADNGRYGEDDALKLAAILGDLGAGLIEALPYDEADLAGIFATSSIDMDNLGIDDDLDSSSRDLGELAEAPRAAITHELMRFKVPIADRDHVQQFIESVIKKRGFSTEKDSMAAAGMALVEIVNAARNSL